MKRMLMLLIAAAVATVATADISAESLARIDRLYQNDMKTAEGRKRWHGNITRQIVSTNDLVKIEIHEDGWTNRVPFKIAKPARPPRVAITNGIPLALLKARIRRVNELNAGTTVTNIVRTVNAP